MAKTNEGSEPRATRFDVAEDACNPEAGGSPSPDRPRQPSNDLISTEKKTKKQNNFTQVGSVFSPDTQETEAGGS